MIVQSHNIGIQTNEIDSTFRSARILYYDFLASFLLYEFLEKHLEMAKRQIDFLAQFALRDGDEMAFNMMKKEMDKGVENLLNEYTRLFSMPSSPVALYLSSWLEECNGGESLVMVRNMLKEHALILSRDVSCENEDHLGILCLFMKQLLEQGKESEAREVFNKTIAKIWERIASGLKSEKGFYAYFAVIMESFFLLETSLMA